VQVCWLYILPCTLVCRWDRKARREFALALPAGPLSRAERAWWAGAVCPSLWQILVLFIPALSLAGWRIQVMAAAGVAGSER
jgi:hypothetical protein